MENLIIVEVGGLKVINWFKLILKIKKNIKNLISNF
jgi:hypothetical protein